MHRDNKKMSHTQFCNDSTIIKKTPGSNIYLTGKNQLFDKNV